MSIEITDGGDGWHNARAKISGDGKLVSKNLNVKPQGVNDYYVQLPPDHPDYGPPKNLRYGKYIIDAKTKQPVIDTKTGKPKIIAITKFEVVQGDKGPQPNQDKWADQGHLDLPDGFDPSGAESLKVNVDPWSR